MNKKIILLLVISNSIGLNFVTHAAPKPKKKETLTELLKKDYSHKKAHVYKKTTHKKASRAKRSNVVGFVRFAEAKSGKVTRIDKKAYLNNDFNQTLPVVLNKKAPTKTSNPVPNGFYLGPLSNKEHVYIVCAK